MVTGAFSGIGKGVALQLAQFHAYAVLAARSTEVPEQVTGQVRAASPQPQAPFLPQWHKVRT